MSNTSGVVTARSILAIVAIAATFGGFPRQGLAADETPVKAVDSSATAPPGTKPPTPATAVPAAPAKGSADGKPGSATPSAKGGELLKPEAPNTPTTPKAGEVDKKFCCTENKDLKDATDVLSFLKLLTKSDSRGAVVFLTLLYLLLVVVTKARMVAYPTRQNCRANVEADIAELANMPARPEIEALKKQLTVVSADLKRTHFWLRLIFWSGGAELAGWNTVHAIACQRIFYIDRPEEIAVDLIAAEDALRLRKDGKDAIAVALAERIKEALPNLTNPVSVGDLPKLKALLAQAKGYLYDIDDTNFADLSTAYNKTYWLVICGLIVIAAIGVIFGNAGFLLLGALGGLLSRLTYSYQRPASPNDYGASWSRFYLSPVVGALTGWSGILLLRVGHQLGILGTFFEANWCDPAVVTFGLAFMFGFSERLFSDVFSQIENKLDPKASDGALTAKPLSVTGSTVPVDRDNRSFEINCVASGGAGGYKWKLSPNAPAGVTVDSQGKLTGTLPAASPPLSIPVTVTDSKNVAAEGTYVVK